MLLPLPPPPTTPNTHRAAQQRARAAAANAYLRISESEIADDYPLPQQYEAAEEEADELLLWDEELGGMDPEDLPKRLLDNFTIYNAEVGFVGGWGGGRARVSGSAGNWVRQ
jgi:hypothetical protein